MLADDLQLVALAHLKACDEALMLEEEEGGEEIMSPASAPYCGCDTCMARELSWAMATELQERGIVE